MADASGTLLKSGEQLKKSLSVLAEAEETGRGIQGELARNRETLEASAVSLHVSVACSLRARPPPS